MSTATHVIIGPASDRSFHGEDMERAWVGLGVSLHRKHTGILGVVLVKTPDGQILYVPEVNLREIEGGLR